MKKFVPNARFDLVDGYERNKQHPDSFFLPPHDEVEALEPGDAVKLIFQPHDQTAMTERMWVNVLVPPTEDQWGVGELASGPMDDNCPIEYLDRVVFERRHIVDIYEPQTSEVSK